MNLALKGELIEKDDIILEQVECKKVKLETNYSLKTTASQLTRDINQENWTINW